MHPRFAPRTAATAPGWRVALASAAIAGLTFSWTPCAVAHDDRNDMTIGVIPRNLSAGAQPVAGAADTAEARIIDYTHIFSAGEARPDTIPALLAAVAQWLAESFDLPATQDLPRLEFAAPARISAMHYSQGFPRTLSAPASAPLPAGEGRAVVAVYDGANEIIYLPDGWRGATPAEQSVLVHEMVHHMQKRARLKYLCPQQREKLAYEAQARWLARFGQSLESEFEIDGMTLLVQINCMM
jgi:hypothetical protein